jgi:hypothetical protein
MNFHKSEQVKTYDSWIHQKSLSTVLNRHTAVLYRCMLGSLAYIGIDLRCKRLQM